MNPMVKSLLQYVGALVLAVLAICLVFPAIPGVTFTGGTGSAIGIVFAEVAISVFLIIVALIFAAIGMVAYGRFPARQILDTIESVGFFGSTAILQAGAVALRTIALLIVSAFASSLAFSGPVALLLASVVLGLSQLPFWDFQKWTRKNFYEQLAQARAKLEKDEAVMELAAQAPAGSVIDARGEEIVVHSPKPATEPNSTAATTADAQAAQATDVVPAAPSESQVTENPAPTSDAKPAANSTAPEPAPGASGNKAGSQQ